MRFHIFFHNLKNFWAPILGHNGRGGIGVQNRENKLHPSLYITRLMGWLTVSIIESKGVIKYMLDFNYLVGFYHSGAA